MMNKYNKKIDLVSNTHFLESQSVRTTFKLSENSMNAIEWIIKKYSLKPKEIFDIICSNENLLNFAIETTKKNKGTDSTKTTRKTFVLSKRVLRLLNRLSNKNKLSRDLIVENLVLLYKTLLEKFAEEEKKKEKKALTIISDFYSKAELVEKQLQDILGDDNPILDRFGYVIILLMNLECAIKSKLLKGVPIDPDDMSQC